MDEKNIGQISVAAGASCFLIVRLQRAGHRVMDDESYVALVDSHSEGVRRDDSSQLFGHE
jgi:hypothetical protein